jgi:hypothetical protein
LGNTGKDRLGFARREAGDLRSREDAPHAVANEYQPVANTVRADCLVQSFAQLQSRERHGLPGWIIKKPELITPPDLGIREKPLQNRRPHLGR